MTASSAALATTIPRSPAGRTRLVIAILVAILVADIASVVVLFWF